ncbi:MAG: 3-dehydroquinate synthase [Chlamydiae bacterium]|nr:3-dehydroquinate synthase [Chlamydiota bacterium]
MKINYEILSRRDKVQLTIEPEILDSEIVDNSRPLAIISDENVAKLHAKPLCQKWKKGGISCQLFTVPAGENSKSSETMTSLQLQLLQAGYGRDCVIIGIGGGVVTDLAGFVASTYCRGVPLILIPTTLLAMVDAALGGKTGINLPQSKNFVGTIYQPESIWIDPNVLETQPLDSFRDGLVEMIKHGLIWDANIFSWIEQNVERLLKKEPSTLKKGIIDSCKIKLSIALRDTMETGLRRLLNFGHTIGHAIETVSNYEVSHGTAVAIGCLVEGHLSHLAQSDLDRIAKLFHRIGISLEAAQKIPAEKITQAMCYDKKGIHSVPRFVTLEAIGKAHSHKGDYCTFINENEISKALEWMHHDLHKLARP